MVKNFKRIMQAPGDFFASPGELVACSDFSPDEKIAILKQWEDEELQRVRADDENMPDNHPDEANDAQLLADIRSSIVALEHVK